jgi:tRNA (mo5U34)-methyltransferase
MEPEEVRARVASLSRWRYRFDLGSGITTPGPSDDQANRAIQRTRYAFDRLLHVMGGSLDGHRVLDLACNAGWWSLKAIEAGADFVLGVDGRQIHIDQARLVFEAKGIAPDRFHFDVGNILEYPFGTGFDVVLCFGLMYHVSKPVEMFEVMTRAGAEIIVIDTAVTLDADSSFKVHKERTDVRNNAVDYEIVFYPSRQAVIDLAKQFGFRAVPLALNVTDWRGMPDYRSHKRVAFICAKDAPLDMLAIEGTPLVAQAGPVGMAARFESRIRGRLASLVNRSA